MLVDGPKIVLDTVPPIASEHALFAVQVEPDRGALVFDSLLVGVRDGVLALMVRVKSLFHGNRKAVTAREDAATPVGCAWSLARIV